MADCTFCEICDERPATDPSLRILRPPHGTSGDQALQPTEPARTRRTTGLLNPAPIPIETGPRTTGAGDPASVRPGRRPFRALRCRQTELRCKLGGCFRRSSFFRLPCSCHNPRIIMPSVNPGKSGIVKNCTYNASKVEDSSCESSERGTIRSRR